MSNVLQPSVGPEALLMKLQFVSYEPKTHRSWCGNLSYISGTGRSPYSRSPRFERLVKICVPKEVRSVQADYRIVLCISEVSSFGGCNRTVRPPCGVPGR